MALGGKTSNNAKLLKKICGLNISQDQKGLKIWSSNMAKTVLNFKLEENLIMFLSQENGKQKFSAE